jgi:DNA helicase-2/ATP-dependent DNA helicase PcrA
MHKAKGLTADIVFVVGAEDEHIPGRQIGEEQVGDERRLLYVSLTRAKHHMYITFCQNRIGQQAQLGSNGGNPRRHLTRFLVDAPIRPKVGRDIVREIINVRR